MDVAVLLATATIGRMIDPIIAAAGIIPYFMIKPWRQSLLGAAIAGAFVAIVSAALNAAYLDLTGVALSLAVTTAAAVAWWAIVFAGMRVTGTRRA